MIDLSTLKAVNRTAGLVTSRGFQYTPDKKILQVCQREPLPIRKIPRCNPELNIIKVGDKIGRLTVVGLLQESKKGWLMRCDCGNYTTRKTKSVLNPKNHIDRCDECRHLAYLKRMEKFLREGKVADYVGWV